MFQSDEELSGIDSTLTQLSRVMPTSSSMASAAQQHQIHRLLSQLNEIDFADINLNSPNLNIFDPGQVANVLKDLETTNDVSGARAVDVKTLHAVLAGNLQGAAHGQKQVIEEEIQRFVLGILEFSASSR